MKFGIEKCGILIINKRERQTMEGIELPKQKKIRTLGEMETYKYLGKRIPTQSNKWR